MAKSKLEIVFQPWIIVPIVIGVLLYFGTAKMDDIERLITVIGEAIGNIR